MYIGHHRDWGVCLSLSRHHRWPHTALASEPHTARHPRTHYPDPTSQTHQNVRLLRHGHIRKVRGDGKETAFISLLVSSVIFINGFLRWCTMIWDEAWGPSRACLMFIVMFQFERLKNAWEVEGLMGPHCINTLLFKIWGQ